MALKQGNRFFRPSVAEYTSQFVEEDTLFPEMVALAERDMQKRDQARGLLMESQLDVQALPEHQEFKDELLTGYDERINNLAQSLSRGEHPDAIIGSLSKIRQDWMRDPQRQQLETSYADYQKASEDERKLALAGKRDDIYSPYRGFTGKTAEGQFQPFTYQGITGQQRNVRQLLQESTKNITPDSADFRSLLQQDDQGNFAMDDQGRYIWKSTQNKSIGVDKVLGIADLQTQNAIDDPRGQYATDQLFGQKVDYYSLDNNVKRNRGIELYNNNGTLDQREVMMTDQEMAYNNMRNRIATEGATKMFSSRGQQFSIQHAPKTDSDDTDPNKGPSFFTPYVDEVEYNQFVKKKDLKERTRRVAVPHEETYKKGEVPLWQENQVYSLKKEKYYNELKDQAKTDYDNIIKQVVRKDSQGWSDERYQKYANSDEAHELVKSYYDNIEKPSVTPSLSDTHYRYTDSHGIEQVNYDDAKKELQVHNEGRVFYDQESGEVLSSEENKRKQRKLVKAMNQGNFEFMGDWSYMSFVPYKTGVEGFANSLAIKTVDPDSGEAKTYWVTRNASEQKSPEGRKRVYWNTIFNETQRLPGVAVTHTRTDNKGNKKAFNVTYQSDTKSYLVESKDAYKGQKIEFTTDELGAIDTYINQIAEQIYSTNER